MPKEIKTSNLKKKKQKNHKQTAFCIEKEGSVFSEVLWMFLPFVFSEPTLRKGGVDNPS